MLRHLVVLYGVSQSRPQSLRYFCPAEGASSLLYKRVAVSGNEIASEPARRLEPGWCMCTYNVMQNRAENGYFWFHRITKKHRNSKIMSHVLLTLNAVILITHKFTRQYKIINKKKYCSFRRNLSGLRGNSMERNDDQENK